MQGRNEVLAALTAVWERLQAGETGEAERELARAEGLGATKADVCLMRAHIAEAKGAFREALQVAYEGLAEIAEQGAADADAGGSARGVAADAADVDAATVSHSLERLAARVGEKSTGFTWEAIFASTGAANAASARYSMLIGQANAQAIAKDAKARLTKHFALCTVTCDYSLRDREGKGASLLGRLRGRFGKRGARPADGIRPAHDGSGFISPDGPAYELSGPFREDEWSMCNA